jgi:hypothetical protein
MLGRILKCSLREQCPSRKGFTLGFDFQSLFFKIGFHRKGCEFVLASVSTSCINHLGWMFSTDMKSPGKAKQKENAIMKN